MLSFIKETIIYGFANIFSRVSAFILLPLYTLYLGKIDYSNLVMLMSMFTVFSFLLALNSGVFYYYYEYENKKYRKIVFTSWFYYEMIVSSFLVLSLFFFSPYLKGLFLLNSDNSIELQLSIVIIGLQLFPVSIINTYINFHRINRKPKKVLTIVSLEAFLIFIFTLFALTVIEKSLISVIIAQLCAKICVAIFSFKLFQNISIKYFSKKLLLKLISFSWPFFIISSFGWGIAYADKFVGSKVLIDKTDVALLALSSQLVIPIAILAQMINQALGPYIMSIRNQKNANNQYQQILELTVFIAAIVSIGVVGSSPIVVGFFFDTSYREVLYVMPFMAFATVIYLMANQFSVGFSLVKKTGLIAIATLIASAMGVGINILFMKDYGYMVAGVSQIVSYASLAIILYFIGTKNEYISFKLFNSLLIVFLLAIFICTFITFLNFNINEIYLLLFSILVAIGIVMLYIKQQNLDIKETFKKIKNKK